MSELPTTEPMTPDERIALLEREVSAAQYRIERDGAEIERLRSQLTDFHNIDDVGEIRRLVRENAELRAELNALNPRRAHDVLPTQPEKQSG